MIRYTATITSATLRLYESRIIADLLLQGLSKQEWQEQIIEKNILQMRSLGSIKRVSRLLRSRIEPLGEELWQLIRDGAVEQATQCTMAGAIKHSRLLGDFMDITIREQKALFAVKLERRIWNEYIENCRGRDPQMPEWSEGTLKKLRSSIFSMLSEAGYLKDTRSLLLQNVFVDSQLSQYLRKRGENYVLRCLEVME